MLNQFGDTKTLKYLSKESITLKQRLYDEVIPPMMGSYQKDYTKAWSAKINSFDAFVFVTPEYNHSTSGALKNALDYLFKEWNNKSAGFVSYGSAGGIRFVGSF